ncbi:OmpH family outer membrane protein [Candidatus Methylomirabilis sp.]|uniref:OmpH family outer membrane protein n=1 Tax=Candidatus Methylomirabilis sp. TaxID=2032687 RepID=UPI0030763D6D
MARVMYGWRWRVFWGIVAVVVLRTSVSWAAEPPSKLGFVDLQAVISQSKEGQEAMNAVKAEATEKQKEIGAKEAEIKQMDTDLQKQASALSDAAKKDREEEIRRRLRDLKRITEDFNRDLAKREGEMVNDLLRDITVVIRDYGKEKGFTLIIEKGQSGVIYGHDAADLTKEILDRYNARRSKKK